MSMLTTVSWVFALLLAIAGTEKLRGSRSHEARGGPAPPDRRVSSVAMRVLGIGEVALGLSVLLVGGRIAALGLAVGYAAFAGVAERQRRRGAGCGCFGTQTQATRLHVWVDVAAAGVAAGAAAWPGASLPTTVEGHPLTGALTMVLLVVAATLLRMLLTEAPELNAAVVRVTPRSDA